MRVSQVDRQSLNRRFFEHAPHRKLNLENATNTGNHLQHQQRVPSQLKKILIDSYLIHCQQFPPDFGELALCLIARWYQFLPVPEWHSQPRRERFAIDLATGEYR